MTSGLITAVKSLRRIILFQLLVHLAPQRITWLLCYFKIDFISQEKRQGRDFRTQRLFTALWWSSYNIII